MKRFLCLILMLSLLTNCDDGDLTVDTIEFEDVNASSCENLIYKINDTEALIIEIPNIENVIVNDPTPLDEPMILEINGTSTRVIYRSYSGNVSAASFCGNIPPPEPVVEEEWTASSGTIEITTTAVKTPNDDLEGGEVITGYRHQIIFRNIEFDKPEGSQLYEEFMFGNYTTSATNLTFAFTDEADRCSSGRLYNWISAELIMIDNLQSGLIANTITPLGEPRTALIGAENNTLTYSVFPGGLSTAYDFCALTLPGTPQPIQVWTGAAGVEGMSGVIEVTTTTTSGGFLHEIHLRDVTLQSGNSAFVLADDFLFGTIITSN